MQDLRSCKTCTCERTCEICCIVCTGECASCAIMCHTMRAGMCFMCLCVPNYAGNANTQHSPRHAMLSRVMCHLHPLQCLHGITFDSSHNAGGAPPPPHTPPAQFTFLLLRYWLSRAKLCCFSAKSDRCDSRTRHSDGSRRCKRASMQFNTCAESPFLRLPRSCRVAEKSSQIGSREPNCAVFQ